MDFGIRISECGLRGWAMGLLVAVSLLMGGGCQTSRETTKEEASVVPAQQREGYALLHDLVNRQRGVSKILILKKPSDETAAIVKDIAATATEATTKLEAFAKERGLELTLAMRGLPKFDAENRQSVEARTTKYLLFGSGDSFEVKLIYTQLNACEYGLCMARLLASLEGVPEEHKAYLTKFADAYESYFDRLIARLETK